MVFLLGSFEWNTVPALASLEDSVYAKVPNDTRIEEIIKMKSREMIAMEMVVSDRVDTHV
jgi:hypothetical protein